MTVPFDPRITTGLQGLDELLNGGLTPSHLYLLEGKPGSGKTTLALQFLRAGVAAGERCLYVTLSETAEELGTVAQSHDWSMEGIDLFELSAARDVLGEGREQSLLHPWEIELTEIVTLITAEVERVQPRRVVFDSLSELRLLAHDALRYRRQLLSLKQFFAGRQTTVVLVDDLTSATGDGDSQLHSLCHGVVTLTRTTLEFGGARRSLEVQKMRGVDFSAGYHDFVIRKGGIQVFPRLIAAEHHAAFAGEPVKSGLASLDDLLGGGPLRGTSMLLTGPPGSGKTTLAMHYADHACKQGQRCTMYQFDERVGTLLVRTRSIDMPLDGHLDEGSLRIEQIDPAEVSPGEFTWRVRREVEERGAKIIMIDSLAGYLAAMPEEQALVLQMHELISYLNQQGVLTILINPQQGLIGSMNAVGINVSYLADSVLILRFFEDGGRVRKAISVLKNRGGAHEDTIREFRIDRDGVRIGAPLSEFHGVLTGTPSYVGPRDPLMEDRGDVA
jgi:circadian clock protein KaiC